MARVETRQWPLRAAATPKELILRGAYRIDVKKARWGSRKVTLLPQEGRLPSSLESFDAALRPWTPGDVETSSSAPQGHHQADKRSGGAAGAVPRGAIRRAD